ncbi:MAG: BrnT family toxin [Terracidiphilus sp.]
MSAKDPLAACVGFDWDDANAIKNWERHRVTPEEAEDLFFHDPFVLRSDAWHSAREKRYLALGQTAQGRRLFVAFTIRGKRVRVISVRDMSQREIEEYERHEKSDS